MAKKRMFIEKRQAHLLRTQFPKNWALGGQGIVEYILITALVALAAVAMFRLFRDDIKEAYRRAGQALVQGVSEGVSDENDTAN